MDELKELPERKSPEIKDSKRKKPSSSDPEIETPPPPQDIDPSAPIEEKKPATSSGKRKRIPLKQHVKVNTETALR